MKINLHSIRLSIKLPEFNFKEKDKEIYDKHKSSIISKILAKEFADFSPTFTAVGDELFIEFDMHKYPEYNIIGHFFSLISKRKMF